MIRFHLCGLALCLWMGGATAAGHEDALGWLSRMAASSQRLTYSGTFIYQSGKLTETSRIFHLSDSSGECERLETLDGTPREVVRGNGDVEFFLPKDKTVISDRVIQKRFPAWGHLTPSALTEFYRARMGGPDRVAGIEVQQLVLEPRDGFRYGHQFWVDPASGLLIKSRMLDEHGGVVEQFAFSDVSIGAHIDREKLHSRYSREATDWKRVNARGQELRIEDSPWTVVNPLPGFRQISAVQRPLRRAAGDAVHLVYSDGLAIISVFIEPVAGRKDLPDTGASVMGPTQIFKRLIGKDYLVVALGEVPAPAVRRFAESVEAKRK